MSAFTQRTFANNWRLVTKMNIAVIPARGGSKRIPRKNIRLFCGKPMIAWSIQTAMESNLFDRIIVSTDDPEIADLAMAHGAEAPFLRPASLADDHTATAPVIAHAIRTLSSTTHTKRACCIYPCAPFMRSADLAFAHALAESSGSAFVYPVTEYPHPVQRAMRMLPDGRMQFISPQFELSRTQDLEPTFHDTGQFYWGTADAWLAERRMHTDGIAFAVPNWRVVDIDTDDDWKRAELLFSALGCDERQASAP